MGRKLRGKKREHEERVCSLFNFLNPLIFVVVWSKKYGVGGLRVMRVYICRRYIEG